MKRVRIFMAILSLNVGCGGPLQSSRLKDDSTVSTFIESNPKYLLFQAAGALPIGPGNDKATVDTRDSIADKVDEIINELDGELGDHKKTQLGIAVGPIMFDLSDREMKRLIEDAFAVAEEKEVAVAFHIDDSMFWNGRKDLWSDKNNVEWTDWDGTTQPHRIIGWVADGLPILAPQMCYNSPAIIAETRRIAREVIGATIKKGIDRLQRQGKAHLFAGVMAGWETRLQDDSKDPVTYYGYCALTNLGYSKSQPPKNMDAALVGVVKDWIKLWTKSLGEAGIPRNRIHTHIGFGGEYTPTIAEQLKGIYENPIGLRDYYKHSPPEVAVNDYSNPGFSIYGADYYDDLYRFLEAHPDVDWGIAEGTNVILQDAYAGGTGDSGYSMEHYLARAFNHGAAYVNLFGWSKAKNPDAYAIATTGEKAIAAYKKFLSGEKLMESERKESPSQPGNNPGSGNGSDLQSLIKQLQQAIQNAQQDGKDLSFLPATLQELEDLMAGGNAQAAIAKIEEILEQLEKL